MNPDSHPAALRAVPEKNATLDRWAMLLLGAVLLATFAHRMFLLFSTQFPLNDGGLFYAFVEQILPMFPGMPEVMRYNGLDLPFAYPPLSFWLVALLGKLGIDTLPIFHAGPIFMNLAYVGLFALVLRRGGASLMFVALAMLFFCTQQRTFEWLIMGGGIPRSLGSILLLATLLVVGTPDGKERKPLSTPRMIAAGVLVGLTILSHLEWGLNAAVAVILGRSMMSPGIRHLIRELLVSGATAALVIAPWVYFVLAAHGLEPFLAAGASGHFTNLMSLSALRAVMAWGLMNPLIVVGVILLVARRQYYWLAFFVTCLILTPRHAETPVTMPLAFFAATGAVWFFTTLLQPGRNKLLGWAAMLFFIGVVTIPRFNADYVARGATLHALEGPHLEAMDWVKRNHPSDSFIVLEKYGWWSASSAEWFPVLTGTRSTNTVQGREWIKGSYQQFYNDDMRLKWAIIQRIDPESEEKPTCEEVRQHLAAFERPRFLWAEIAQECLPSDQFRPVFRNRTVTIYELTPAVRWIPRPVSETPTAD